MITYGARGVLNSGGIYGDIHLGRREKKGLTLTLAKETKVVNNIVTRTVKPVGGEEEALARSGD